MGNPYRFIFRTCQVRIAFNLYIALQVLIKTLLTQNLLRRDVYIILFDPVTYESVPFHRQITCISTFYVGDYCTTELVTQLYPNCSSRQICFIFMSISMLAMKTSKNMQLKS